MKAQAEEDHMMSQGQHDQAQLCAAAREAAASWLLRLRSLS